MNRAPKQFRQGDVFLVQVREIPKKAAAVEREKGRIVLAYGEATGHAHAVLDADVQLLALGDARFLEVGGKGATVRHEEHAPIKLAPGLYEVKRQREYSPEEIRNVAD